MPLKDYTHLLNYITWFNEASIQSKLNNDFGSNLSISEVITRTDIPLLTLLRDELVATLKYMFNKPDVSSSTVETVDVDDVTVAAVWPGVSKTLVSSLTNHVVGSEPVFEKYKKYAWNNLHETGLYTNTFEDEDGKEFIGISVSMLDVIIVIIIETVSDNSVPPERHGDPSDPSDDRGDCTDGLDIEICSEEEDDDCDPIEITCDSNFSPAN